MDKVTALGRTVLFGNLQVEELRELASLARERALVKGEVLFLAGERAAGLFVIASGRIRAFRVSTLGREQTIHVEREGATLAEVPVFDDGAYPATAVAEEPTRILFLDKGDVQRFMLKHPQVAITALKLMAQRLRGHAELVDALSLQQVGQRVARFLLAQGRDHGSPVEGGVQFDLTISNDELARQIGSVREVVSRTLSRLEKDGLIAQIERPKPGKGRRFVIADAAALSRYAGEDEQR